MFSKTSIYDSEEDEGKTVTWPQNHLNHSIILNGEGECPILSQHVPFCPIFFPKKCRTLLVNVVAGGPVGSRTLVDCPLGQLPSSTPKFHPNDHPLLILQRLNRIGDRRPDRLVAYRQEGDHNGHCTGQQKDPPTNTDAVGEIFQPTIHKIPGDRRSNKQGNEDQFEKVFGQ